MFGVCALGRPNLRSSSRGCRVAMPRKGHRLPACPRYDVRRSTGMSIPDATTSLHQLNFNWLRKPKKKISATTFETRASRTSHDRGLQELIKLIKLIELYSRSAEGMGRQPLMASSPASSPACSATLTTPKPLIRKYRRDGDKEAVVEICRDVYDGRDYIPRVIDSYGSDTDVLVETPSPADAPRALLCGARDGSLYHIWGARTHPRARGRGIMRRMMRHVEERAGTTLISTTIRSNTSMLRLFEGEGYTEYENEIKLWPDSSVMEEEDCTMSFVLAHHARERTCHHPSADRPRQGASHFSLERCSSLEDLRQGLARARGVGCDLWLPASYEVIATDGRVMQNAIDEGDVFVSDHLNAVVAIVGDQLGGTVLSIICSASSLGNVLDAVAARVCDRPIKRMYVDLCGTELSPADFVHGCDKGWASYIVLTKFRDEQQR